MKYRRLGRTGLMVSEIALGAEWLERHSSEECNQIVEACEKRGINLLDCWMSEPKVRSNIGAAIKGKRERWHIQGHMCSTWQDGQYVVSRELDKVKANFEDLLNRLGTDYIDLGMIHYVDSMKEFHQIFDGEVYQYACELREKGVIRHIGLSTHNPLVGKLAVERDVVDMLMFSINPAYDFLPATEDVDDYFVETFDENLNGIDPDREELYKLCEKNDIGITVMKAFAGGRLFDAKQSPFGVALTPVQCIHYGLTRPGVAAIMAGVESIEQIEAAVAYETATEEEKDYASVLANAPMHSYSGQCTYCGHCKPCPKNIDIAMVNKLYDLAVMQPQVPASVLQHYKALEVKASECIDCKGCESRCPFQVKVAERMREAASAFGM